MTNEIKIVNYGGEIQDKKRVGSRGIMSRGRPPMPENPMAIPLPKYTYTEDRPQTRGANAPGTTGTRGGVR